MVKESAAFTRRGLVSAASTRGLAPGPPPGPRLVTDRWHKRSITKACEGIGLSIAAAFPEEWYRCQLSDAAHRGIRLLPGPRSSTKRKMPARPLGQAISEKIQVTCRCRIRL